MTRLFGLRICVSLSLFLGLVMTSVAEERPNDLSRLDPLIGGEWVCVSWDGEAPKHQQVLRWEKILGGDAIRETMEKPEIDFCREGLIYWDSEQECVASLVITNNGLRGQATVSWEEGKSTWIGKVAGPTGRNMKQKETLEILAADRLRLVSFNPTDEGWVQRHVLEYAREAAD